MKNKTLLIHVFITALVILFAAQLITVQAVKPVECNYNGVCEPGEKKDCSDCWSEEEPEPEPEPESVPLQLNHTGSQIVSGSEVIDKKVYHIKYENEEYANTWTSNVNNSFTYATSIGDIDNDEYKEIITIVNAKKTTGKPSGRYEYRKIFVYEDGSTGEPSYTSQDLGWASDTTWDSIIADANNDDENEIILTQGKHIEIYKWNGSDFTHLWSSPNYNSTVWSVDVGDADNDGDNEVVIAMFGIGSAIVYEYLGNDTWGNSITTESIGSCNIDQAKVRDADNDGYNEIVGGGTSNKLNIWEYNSVSGNYDNVFLSDDLGGYTQGVDVGDVNGGGDNEVIVGTAGDTDKIYVFEYDSGLDTYEIIDSVFSTSGVGGLAVGDFDGDNEDEIAAGVVRGVEVFEYEPNLQSVYYFDNGGYIEAD